MATRRLPPFPEALLRAAMAWSLRYLLTSGCPLYIFVLAVGAALMVTRSPAILIPLCDPTSDSFHDLLTMLAHS